MATESDRTSRRETLVKLLRLGGLGAGSAALGWWLSSRSSRPEEQHAESLARRASVPRDPNLPEMVVAQGDDPRKLVQMAVEALGGIRRFVSRGDAVLIKPNIAWDRTPEQAANTNPDVVAAMVRLCLDAGAKRVMVSDVSCNDARRCFHRSGIANAAGAEGAEVILPDERRFRRVELGQSLGSWPVLDPFVAADKVINLPVAKHHSLSRVSLGMKNWLGIVGGARNWLHQDIHTSMVDLAEFASPVLTIVDAYRVLVRNGPTGGSTSDVELHKTLIAGTDPVALDAYAAKTYWDLDHRQLRYLKIAADRGLGQMDFANVRTQIIGMNN